MLKECLSANFNQDNHPDNGKSTSSYIMMTRNYPVSFKGSSQGLMTQSTMEAKLVAVALAMRKDVFCQNIITELGVKGKIKCVLLHIDNFSTTRSQESNSQLVF